jgi:hypothetical protein
MEYVNAIYFDAKLAVFLRQNGRVLPRLEWFEAEVFE